MSDRFYTEELIRLPQTFLCFQAPENPPPVENLPALETRHVTFGTFNNHPKITPEVIDLWSEILNAVPNARLTLKSGPLTDKKTRQRLKESFFKKGIVPDRIDLHGFVHSFYDHLQLYNQIDIGLDTFPYNGTTTTCEALWMGVPVIVLKGDRHASRVGVSILTGVGLNDFIATSREDYVEKAIHFVRKLDRLQALRTDLRAMMTHSPLMDAQCFTHSMEEKYKEMWRRWCVTKAPELDPVNVTHKD